VPALPAGNVLTQVREDLSEIFVTEGVESLKSLAAESAVKDFTLGGKTGGASPQQIPVTGSLCEKQVREDGARLREKLLCGRFPHCALSPEIAQEARVWLKPESERARTREWQRSS
jgi:hypothetical protein